MSGFACRATAWNGAGRETFRGMALVWAVVVTLPWTPLLFLRRGGLRLRDRAPTTLFSWGIVAITGFWCLTSRVPLAYLLPVVPLFAARLALQDLPPWTARAAPAAVGICIVALVGTIAATSLGSDKMPGWRFRILRAADPTRGVFFQGKKCPPYSAEFYFGPRLHLVRQPGDRLFIRKDHRWKEVTP